MLCSISLPADPAKKRSSNFLCSIKLPNIFGIFQNICSCPKNLSPSLDSTIADDCPDLNDEQFLENLSAICFTKINFYCRSGEKAVIQLSVFDHMLSGQEEFEAEE